jgi:RAD51-like protein 2
MSRSREIQSLPLDPSTIEILQNKGFHTVADFEGMKALDLSRELELPHDVALRVLQSIDSKSILRGPNASVNAKDILCNRVSGKSIVTFCKGVDSIMGGGVPLGQITEFCGVPGIGKTQLMVQLALDVQIPETFGGNGAEAVYIDTEGGFMVERVAEMAESLSGHLVKLGRSKASRNNPDVASIRAPTKEALLEGVHVFRAHDQSELLSIINHLGSFLKLKTRIKFVAIDSIAFHFRQLSQDASTRNRVLSSVAQTLNQIAYDHGIAVVVTNHVTTRIDSRQPAVATGMLEEEYVNSSPRLGDNASSSVSISPALGEQWSHCVTNRIMLEWAPLTNSSGNDYHAGIRHATVLKSPGWPMASAEYDICSAGLRDPATARKVRKKQRDEQVLKEQSETAHKQHEELQGSSNLGKRKGATDQTTESSMWGAPL